MSLAKRPLGRSGISIAPLMFGGNVFGWTADRDASFALLYAFVGAGFDAIDTADGYSRWAPSHVGGESETIIGDWLAARGGRARVVIATKVAKLDTRRGLSAANIAAACDDSLRRLKTDYIDLYQAHEDDLSVPMEETLGAFARLIEQGKVRAIGASNFTAPRLAEALSVSAAHGLPRYETLQPEYNLVRRAYEADLEPLCRAEGLGVIPFYGLASGFLTGKYRSQADLTKSARGAGIGAKYLNDSGFAVLAALDAVSAELSATPAQVALAWLMAKPTVTAPIASATSVTQLEEIMGAARLTLTAEMMGRLDQAGRSKTI